MQRSLPERPDLEHLKGQAKALLTSFRQGDLDALKRVAEWGFQAPFKLAHAQTVLAREYAFESWAKLKRHVETQISRQDAFFAAVKAGDRTRVSDLLDADPELVRARAPLEFDAPAISVAANRNDLPMIDLLLERGADIDARSTWWAGGFGALDTADEATCRELLDRGASLTAHAAARLGMVEELREILKRNPNAVHERGGDGQFPLHFSKSVEIVDILIDAGAHVDARDLDHCGTAVQFRIKDAEVRDRLVAHGATPDIFTAVMQDDAEWVRRLLTDDPESADRRPTDPGNPEIPSAPGGHIYVYTIGNFMPHQVAYNHGKTQAWQALYALAGPSRKLAMAVWTADADLAQEVLKSDPNACKGLAEPDVLMLNGAAWERKTRSVELMLKLGWPIDVPDDEAMTPLMRAAFHGFADIVALILPLRPNLLQRNVYGGDALGTCLYGSIHGWRKDANHPRTVELLLEAGIERPKQRQGGPAVQEVLRKYGVE